MKSSSNKRPATHAGSWYDDDPSALSKEIEKYISSAQESKTQFPNDKQLKAVIVPHAGYYYSGKTAGAAFIHLDPSLYDRVVVLGPSHYASFLNCYVTSYEKYETPFGDIDIDTDAIAQLIKTSGSLFKYAPKSADMEEHSIEMELPFIQYIFSQKKKNFKLIPIIVGFSNDNRSIASALNEFMNDDKTLIVISSDFCHWGNNFDYTYYDKSKGEIYKSIEFMDKMGIELMSKMKSKELDEYFEKYENTICGRYPIEILMNYCELNNIDESNAIFKCEKYTQSEKVTKKNQNSVSYAGCVLFVAKKK